MCFLHPPGAFVSFFPLPAWLSERWVEKDKKIENKKHKKKPPLKSSACLRLSRGNINKSLSHSDTRCRGITLPPLVFAGSNLLKGMCDYIHYSTCESFMNVPFAASFLSAISTQMYNADCYLMSQTRCYLASAVSILAAAWIYNHKCW